jgi:hypothetical protein
VTQFIIQSFIREHMAMGRFMNECGESVLNDAHEEHTKKSEEWGSQLVGGNDESKGD